MKRTLSFGITCLFILLAIPRVLSLDAHWSSDEARWLLRSEHFISAVKKGAFSDTLVTYHPGVTTMWISGFRTFFMELGVDVPNLAKALWFVGLVVWVGIGIASLLLYPLFGKWFACASFASLAYSPFFLAQTRRVHTDALATIFILLTVLLFFRYFQNRHRCRYLVFSGITFGFALLSKSYALILLLWLPLCLFLFTEKRHGRTLSLTAHVGVETALGGLIAMSLLFSKQMRDTATEILEKLSAHTLLLMLVVMGIFVGILFCIPKFAHHARVFLKTFSSLLDTQRLWVNVLLSHSLLWICQGLAFFLFVRSLASVQWTGAAGLTACFAFAWIVGFLSFLTPGGLGIREGLLGLLLANYMPAPKATLIAMLCRVWILSAEMFLAAIALFLNWRLPCSKSR